MTADLFTTAVGVAAAVLSVTSFVPQIAKIVRTRDVSGISLHTYAFTVTCFALWTLYGLRLTAWPLAIANALCFVLSAAVLLLKWRFGGRKNS